MHSLQMGAARPELAWQGSALREHAEFAQGKPGSTVFVEIPRAIADRDLVKPQGFIVVSLKPIEFGSIEIGLTYLSSFRGHIQVIGSRQHRGWRLFPKQHVNHRRRPFRHVELACRFPQIARHGVAPFGHIKPDRNIDIIGLELCCLLEIGLCLGKLAGIEIENTSTQVAVDIFGVKEDHRAVFGNGAGIVTLGSPNQSSTLVRIDVFGIETDRLVVIDHGAIVVALGGPPCLDCNEHGRFSNRC